MSESGRKVEALENMPDMDEETVWYLEAFFLLNNSRQTGMSIGSIPLSEIINYGLVFNIITDLHDFCKIIVGMDSVYIEHANSKVKAKSKSK